MSDPRAKIQSALYETDYENTVLEVLAEGIFSGISDFVKGGMTNKLKGDLERGLKKALAKDNKTIIKGIDILKKAYSSRISKLDALKSKISGKIDKNTILTDKEKLAMKQSMDDAIADSREILDSLSGEQDDIEDEVSPTPNSDPKAPETAPNANFKSFVGKGDAVSLPDKVPEAPKVPTSPVTDTATANTSEASKSAEDILNQVNKIDAKKQTDFKKSILRVLTSSGPAIVKKAMDKMSNVKEQVIKEKLSLKHGLAKAAQEASDTISRSLTKEPTLKSQYDSLDPQNKEKVNMYTLTTAIKLAHKTLGDSFFAPVSTDADVTAKPAVAPQKPILPDEAELEAPPKEPVAAKPEIKVPQKPLFPDDAELEAPEAPTIEPKVVAPATPEVKPEVKQTVMKKLSNIPIEGSSNFLKEKGLISNKSVQIFDSLSDQGKKSVIDYAITVLDKVVSGQKDKINEVLTADDLGLSGDVDLGNSHKGIIRNISSSISNFIKRIHLKENPKAKKVKQKAVPVAKTKPVAKAAEPAVEPKPIVKAPIVKAAEPVKAPVEKPKVEPISKAAEPVKAPVEKPKVDADSDFKNSIGDDLYNIMVGPENKELMQAAKSIYSNFKDSGRPVSNERIRQSVDSLIDRWDDRLNEMHSLKESVRNAIRGFNELEVGLTGAQGDVKSHTPTTLTMTVGDVISFVSMPVKPEPDENKLDSQKKTINKNPESVLSPNKIKNVRKSVAQEAIDAKDVPDLLEFKKKWDDLIKKSAANDIPYGIIKSIDKSNDTLVVQTLVAKRKLISSKIKFKKIGKPITIRASQVKAVEIPWSDFPKEYAKNFLIAFGISAAAIGASLVYGSKAIKKGLNFLQNQVSDAEKDGV